jgi:hypothetical protein
MIRLPLLLLIFAFAGAAWADPADQATPRPLAIGEPFPRLESEFLTGRKAILPDAARGKVALIMMGFTYDSRFSVEKWAERFRGQFGRQDGVTFFEVPVIGGMARMASWFIDSGMRKGTPKELHENVITVYGGVDRWKTLMGFQETARNDAYLALLDREGRVQWLHHGPATDDAVASLGAVVAAHSGS